MPLGPGTLKIHGFVTNGRRWISRYRGTTFAADQFNDDETRGYIAEYQDIRLFDNRHRLTVGAEYQELDQPASNPMIYIVQSVYVQDIIQLGERLTRTAGRTYGRD